MIIGLIFCAIGYLMGSFSSAIIVARIFNLPDPRLAGSGNPGATNMLRLSGKLPALLVLFGDLLKGAIPILLAHIALFGYFGLAMIGLSAFLGHLFPIYFQFRGGKGVATMLGVYLALFPPLVAVMVIVWLLIAIVTRYASLASIAAALLGVIGVCLFYTSAAIPMLLLTGILIWRHRDNLNRLRLGTENKIELTL